MRLADHILAARDTINDIGRIASSMGRTIERAQRFELHNDVALAAHELLKTRPSTLVAALPLCRLPYSTMWFEWKGGLLGTQKRDLDVAPEPVKEGLLLEEIDSAQQIGCVTLAWMHRRNQLRQTTDQIDALLDERDMIINISPLGVYFDFSGRGDVRTVISTVHDIMLTKNPSARLKFLFELWAETFLQEPSSEALSRFALQRQGWGDKVASNPVEIEALKELERIMLPGLSKHGLGLMLQMLHKAPLDAVINMLRNWMADIEGEGSFVQCVLAILNSKNRVIDNQPVDLSRLNRSRQKRGRSPMLSYSVTHLRMSRAQRNVAEARGLSREQARQHLVRGHFKIRSSGVYWWSSFLRGDPRRPLPRKQYEVSE